jgi:hypothetical protein
MGVTINYWRTIDDAAIAYVQFRTSRESGMLE